MTISTDNIITFGELFNKACDYIYNKCQNIERYDIPEQAKAGWSTQYKVVPQGNPNNTAGGGATISVKDDTVIGQYTLAEVKNNLISFLQSRNSYNKSNVTITSNGILMFWNAVACFCESNCVTLVGEHFDTDSSCIVYYPNNNYTPAPLVKDRTNISTQDINELLNNFNLINQNNTKVHKIDYDVSVFSSCSSSSCSSSSSSSLFVGYIRI